MGLAKQTIIIVIGIFISLILLVILCLILLKDDFKVNSFDEEITINYGDEFIPKPGDVCYGNLLECHQSNYTIEGEVDTSKVNDYIINYNYKSGKKSKVLTQKVKVIDNIAPTITIDNTNLIACPNGKIDNLNISALDNYDGDISSSIQTRIENEELIIESEDSSGNKTIKNIPIKVEDTISPTINITGNKIKSVVVGNDYKDEGATVTDNCDLNINLETDNQVNSKKAGTYYVTYRATDSAGNTTIEKRTVNVYSPQPVTQNNTSSGGAKIVYLTFDDGPSSYTAGLLDVLKKYNVKATFFVTGFGSDDMILREYQEGHTVALHTNTHNYKQVYASVDSYFNDLYTVQNRVERITGYKSNLIRFPGGSSNAVSPTSMSYLTKEVQNRGFHYFDWNVSSGDAGSTTNTNQVYLNVVNNLKSGYSIVLQHDTKGYSVAAVERIIQYGLANGYTFKALDETSPGAHHGTRN